MTDPAASGEALRRELERAIAGGDADAELRARTNLAATLLGHGSGEALAAFEEALSLARRMQDLRREALLCLNFAPALVGATPARALELATRAVEITERSPRAQRVLARLNLGVVWAEGFRNRDQAAGAWRGALALLAEAAAADRERAAHLAGELRSPLARAAQAALALGQPDLAEALAERIDPEALAALRARRAARPATAADLRARRDPAIEEPLVAWRRARASRGIARSEEPPEVVRRAAELASALRLLDGGEAEPRTAPADADTSGAVGFVERAAQLAGGDVDLDRARADGGSLGLSDGDLVFLACAPALGGSPATDVRLRALLALGGEVASDAALGARMLRAAASLAAGSGDEPGALDLCRRGERRLASGSAPALRSELRNEAAVHLLALGRRSDALEEAIAARDLALRADALAIARMAMGNAAVALLEMGRHAEAEPMLETLAREQEAAADAQGLAATRLNLAACRAAGGRPGEVNLDEHSEDPDELLLQAATAGLAGDLDRSIRLHERGIALLERGQRGLREGRARSTFAHVLHDAGRHVEEAEQLRRAVDLLRAGGAPDAELQDLHARLSEPEGRPMAEALDHAGRAVALARGTGDASALARALANQAQLALAAGEVDGAKAAIDEARRLDGAGPYRRIDAEVAAATGDLARAAALLDAEIADARAASDAGAEAAALAARAAVRSRTGAPADEPRDLREAAVLARRAPRDDLAPVILDRLGACLVRQGLAYDATDVLEEALEQARRAHAARAELSILHNLAMAFAEIGDLDASETTYVQVRDAARSLGVPGTEARALFGLGNVAAVRGDHASASAGYREALGLAGRLADESMVAACLDALGSSELREGKPGPAVDHSVEAARRHAAIKEWGHAAADLANAASGYLLLGDGQRAHDAIAESREIAAAHGVQVGAALTGLEGQLAAARGDWESARERFRAAIAELEGQRATFRTPSEQRTWAVRASALYEVAGEHALLAGDGEAALAFLECNRTRFLQAISERRRRLPAGIDPALAAEVERAADHVADVRRRRRRALGQGSAALDRELALAEARFRRANASMEAHRAGEAPLEAFALPDVLQLARSLPVGHAAVSIGVQNRGLGVACVGRGSDGRTWTAARLDPAFGRADLSRLVFGDREAIRTAASLGALHGLRDEQLGWVVAHLPGVPLDVQRRAVAHVCAELGRRIWPAIEPLVRERARQLVLVPGPGLNSLPLHAARLPDGSRAGDRWVVRYAPSLRLHAEAARHPPLAAEPTLGMAVNPTADLEFAPIECREVARHFPRRRVLVGERATVEATCQLIQDADVFYFAGHAAFDTGEPLRSGLECAPAGGSPGALTLAMLLDRVRQSRSRLVVLSACETGRVQLEDTLNDFLGLPGGLVLAGARAVVASFWAVEDLAACLLLDRLFDSWRPAGGDLATALASAQRWMREELTADALAARLGELRAGAEAAGDRAEALERIDAWQRWVAQLPDRGMRPLADETYWAAFHVTGQLEPA